MICTISFTICGLRTSLLVSSLDKHMPWISGQAAHLLLNLHPITRKTTLMQLMNYHVAAKIEFFRSHFLLRLLYTILQGLILG